MTADNDPKWVDMLVQLSREWSVATAETRDRIEHRVMCQVAALPAQTRVTLILMMRSPGWRLLARKKIPAVDLDFLTAVRKRLLSV